MSLRPLLKSIATHPLLAAPSLFVQRMAHRDDVLILTYHRISEQGHYPVPFDSFPTVTLREFEQQLSYLARHYSFITPEQLADHYHNNKPLPPNPCLLTLDDCYKDIIHIVPLLKKYQAHMVFFVPTDYMDGAHGFWWDHLWYIFHQAGGEELVIFGKKIDTTAPENFLEQIALLAPDFLHKSLAEQTAWFHDFYKQHGISEPTDTMRSLLLAWDELASLDKDFVTVGGHTGSHCSLGHQDEQTQREEILASKAILEKHLSNPLRCFAYPYGEKENYNDKSVAIVEQNGFELAFVQNFGYNNQNQNPFLLRRCNVYTGEALQFTLSGYRQFVQGLRGALR